MTGIEFEKIEHVNLRKIWPNEASDFTPWLAENINALGEALGIELELEGCEQCVGDFSLDMLAKDLGSGRNVIIENQLTPTDHDHLGKLLTYAAGYDAAIIIWISEGIREEHRQALDWLNQITGEETSFFGVAVEVLKIGDSKPAFNFKPVVFPNEWQKTKRRSASTVSIRAEAYRAFFQKLIDDLRGNHRFTNARVGQPQSWYSFSSGIQGVYYDASFALGSRVRVDLYIDRDDKALFDSLRTNKQAIEEAFGQELEWERIDERRASRIAVYRLGSIDAPDEQLKDIHSWVVSNLLKFKEVFPRWIEKSSQSEVAP